MYNVLNTDLNRNMFKMSFSSWCLNTAGRPGFQFSDYSSGLTSNLYSDKKFYFFCKSSWASVFRYYYLDVRLWLTVRSNYCAAAQISLWIKEWRASTVRVLGFVLHMWCDAVLCVCIMCVYDVNIKSCLLCVQEYMEMFTELRFCSIRKRMRWCRWRMWRRPSSVCVWRACWWRR